MSDTTTQPPAAPKPKIRPELVISLFSLALSLVAATTNIFHARLQAENQQTAVWPYLEASIGITGEGFKFTVTNKGVGPAIVGTEQYVFNGKTYNNMVDLVTDIAVGKRLDYSIYETTPIANRVLSPQEKWVVFAISGMDIAELAIKNANKVQMRIEFRSIYGKKWLCTEQGVEEVKE
jgi:hypothetical protein